VTDYRRERARETGLANVKNVQSMEARTKGLLKREMPKYTQLADYLQKRRIRHAFEHAIGKYIFDLALIDQGVLIEFDGRYHESEKQTEIDTEKTRSAELEGWVVCRVSVEAGATIHPDSIRGIISHLLSMADKEGQSE